ncbi:hypothetical protein LINPERHAP2_LOCUS3701 [Linum perenne]
MKMGKKKKKAQKTKELSVAIAQDAQLHQVQEEAAVPSSPQSPAPRKRGRPRKYNNTAPANETATNNHGEADQSINKRVKIIGMESSESTKEESNSKAVEEQDGVASVPVASRRSSSRRKSKPVKSCS